MSDRYFLDTNILVYSFDCSEPRKRQIAEGLVAEALRDGNGLISFQVIGEFLSGNRLLSHAREDHSQGQE